MFKQKISISINSQSDRVDIFEEFEILMSNFCKTGQIQGDYETPFVSENELISFQTTMEKNSLSKNYYDEYTRERVKKIEQSCDSILRTEIIGKAVPYVKGPCTCKTHNFIILYSTIFSHTTPLECGNCGKTIPIYRFKDFTHNVRSNIYSWEHNYKACDNLQMGCSVGEQWAMKQMSNVDSQLSKSGLEICNTIKEVAGIRTYYYLFNYRYITHKQDKARKCPSCGSNWLLKEKLLRFYDFQCNKCGIVSSLTTNWRGKNSSE